MNPNLIVIIVALYSFIVSSPDIPQDVKNKVLQVINDNASQLQISNTVSSDETMSAAPMRISNTKTTPVINNSTTTLPTPIVQPTGGYKSIHPSKPITNENA